MDAMSGRGELGDWDLVADLYELGGLGEYRIGRTGVDSRADGADGGGRSGLVDRADWAEYRILDEADWGGLGRRGAYGADWIEGMGRTGKPGVDVPVD